VRPLFKIIFTRLNGMIADVRKRFGSHMLGRIAIHHQFCHDAVQATS
jgi:hypothetical protein